MRNLLSAFGAMHGLGPIPKGSTPSKYHERKNKPNQYRVGSEFKDGKRVIPKIGRNEPCPCGSEKKFKKCCVDYITFLKKLKAALKGAKGGNCNREQCQQPGAVFFNKIIKKYYCYKCADDLNQQWSQEHPGETLCFREELQGNK